MSESAPKQFQFSLKTAVCLMVVVAISMYFNFEAVTLIPQRWNMHSPRYVLKLVVNGLLLGVTCVYFSLKLSELTRPGPVLTGFSIILGIFSVFATTCAISLCAWVIALLFCWLFPLY
jgi:hypothetical protein